MATFPQAVVDQILADCKRHCCLCWRWCGARIHVHHILPEAEDGPGTRENAMPVCLDCHAEIESRSNMGRRLTERELREHRDQWLQLVRDRPEHLIRAAERHSETGPLEALLAELAYNAVVVDGANGPLPAVKQFERAIGANAFSALSTDARNEVHQVYMRLNELVRLNLYLLNLSPGSNSANATSNVITEHRFALRQLIPLAVAALENALGRGD